MWVINNDTYKWSERIDQNSVIDFESYKQDLKSLRFYQKCLSGSTYVGVDDTDNLYDILDEQRSRTYYYDSGFSPYITSGSPIGPNQIGINGATSGTYSQYEFINKFVPEYGHTLKNLFTPSRLIKDQIKNLFYVDIATNESIDNIGSESQNLLIDGIRVKEGHKVLVKDQTIIETINAAINPGTYYIGHYDVVEIGTTQSQYRVPTSENGIYEYRNKKLSRTTDLDQYGDVIKYGICVKLGEVNREKQFNLERINSGFFPEYQSIEPIYFKERHNYVLRNRVDYNNIYEILLNDTLKHGTQSIYYPNLGITYSIPERTISIGEFGTIINNQETISSIINNKYKSTLRSIDETSEYYWVCGDGGIILKVDKINFEISRIYLDVETRLNQISFFSDLRGVIIGRFNQIWITENGGANWSRIRFKSFEGYNYNCCLFTDVDRFYIGGDNGVFIEFYLDSNDWISYKRRISKFELDDEFLLVDDVISVSLINSSYIIIGSRNNNIFIYDTLNLLSSYDFVNINGNIEVSDITSIIEFNTSIFFSTFDKVYETSIVGLTPSNLNTINATFSEYLPISGINKIFNYNNLDIILAGNNSKWKLSDGIGSLLDVYDDDNLTNYAWRMKPRFLFMNYDIGSKLYWFDDYGQYRIPDRFSIDTSDVLSSSFIDFRSQSGEVSWIDYWKDRMKTFGYATGDMSDSTKVEINFKFRESSTSGTYSYGGSDVDITYDASVMPITHPSKFRPTSAVSAPSSDLYFYDYLGVWNSGPDVNIGDVIQIQSNEVSGRFVVNRIESDYAFFFTDFNENIINNLSQAATSSIIVQNLNLYSNSDVNVFIDNFKNHYIYNAYGIEIYGTQSLEIFGKYSKYSAYYNLEIDLEIDTLGTYDLNYPDGFLNFGYTPNYNLLSYLTFINPNLGPTKEFLSLPIFENIPFGSSTTNVYMDIGISSHNKIRFGDDIKHIWESLLKWTFVDVEVSGTPSILKEGLIIVDKYYEEDPNYVGLNWIIEFHDIIGSNWSSVTDISIRSRRTLLQISNDLKYFNNFHRPNDHVSDVYDLSGSPIVSTYSNYETDIKYKIPTDSYLKAMLSDSEFFDTLSGIVYTDDKNELSLQIVKLDKEFEIEITSCSQSQITLSDYHNLSTGDGILIEYTGTSSVISQNSLGYRSIVSIIDDYNIEIGLTMSFQSGLVIKYVKKDPFLNYQPIDIFDLGIGDKKIKQSVEITPEKYDISGDRYFLKNMDYNKFRFRLIDGMDIEILSSKYPWILEAEIRDAVIGMSDQGRELVWYKGVWECGRWFGGRWVSGMWLSGDWYSGTWDSKNIKDKFLSIGVDDTKSSNLESSKWFGGRWFGGTWNGGTWYDGRWYGGTWRSGRWFDGTWNDGKWLSGEFLSGVWILGEWEDGIFNTDNGPSFWLDGKFMGGDFENGIWYNGEFKESNGLESRFGTKSSNTRNANWLGGKFLSGQFHSYLNTNDLGNPDVSDTHKYSNWYTGFFSGDLYGGNVHNINFNSGVWHGGVLNDIDIVGIYSSTSNIFTVDGIYRFNIGDQFYVVDDLITSTYSVFGSTQDPIKYKVMDTTLDESLNVTEIYVDRLLSNLLAVDTGTYSSTGLKLVSKFSNSFFNSGIWFNGVFESGSFNGGIWYNGNFSGEWG